MKKKSVAIDMDNVIADVTTHYITWYEKQYGERIQKEAILGLPEAEAFPNGAVMQFLFTPGFFRTVPVMPGAQEAVKKIQEHFEVYIVSAAMEFPHSLSEKYAWLQEHFPTIHWRNMIFCGDKSVIATDYLIDDHLKNLDSCSGKPILFAATHNTTVNHHVRVNDWKEAVQLLYREEGMNEELRINN